MANSVMIPSLKTNIALTGLALSMMLSSLGISIVNVALPKLSIVFHSSFQKIQWLVLAYLLTLTVLSVSVGKIGDLVGKKRILLFGIILFSFASGCCTLSSDLELLICLRFLQGTGACIMMVFSLALVGDIFSKEKTGRAMGVLGTSSALGTALGPSVGGLIISSLSWRFLFAFTVPLGLLSFVMLRYSIAKSNEPVRLRHLQFDYAGTLLLSLSIASYALAMTIGKGHFTAINYILILMATGGLYLFIKTEGRTNNPIVNLTLFRDAELNLSLLSSMVVSMVLMSTLIVGVFYLTYGLKLETSAVGLLMSVGPMVVIISGIPSGYFTDRVGYKYVSRIGLLLIALGSLMFSFLPLSMGMIGYVVPLVITTFGYSLFQTSNNTGVLKDAGQDRRGMLSGILSLSRNIGLVTGTSVMGAIFYFATGTSDVTKLTPTDTSNGLHQTFLVAAIAVVTVLIISLKRIKTQSLQ